MKGYVQTAACVNMALRAYDIVSVLCESVLSKATVTDCYRGSTVESGWSIGHKSYNRDWQSMMAYCNNAEWQHSGMEWPTVNHWSGVALDGLVQVSAYYNLWCSITISQKAKHVVQHSVKYFFFLVVKGPAADATDAPQPWGFLCNSVMKMISFFRFSM
jgi:hypothetical protein